MTAKEQLRALVGELNEEQAERALAVLESAADWVILGERSTTAPAPQQRRPAPAEHGSRRPTINVPVGAGRHRGY